MSDSLWHRGIAPALLLRDDERDYLAKNSERCPIETCAHLKVLHDYSEGNNHCPLCDCDLRVWIAEHEGKGHTITHVSASRVTSERYTCDCRSSYEVGAPPW